MNTKSTDPSRDLRTGAAVLHAFVKVPDKLSEVLGVLELCGGGGSGGSGAAAAEDKTMSGNTPSGSAAIKIGAVTGVAIIKGRWAQRGTRSPLPSVANTDSADSTTSTSSEVQLYILELHQVFNICSSVARCAQYKMPFSKFCTFNQIFRLI